MSFRHLKSVALACAASASLCATVAHSSPLPSVTDPTFTQLVTTPSQAKAQLVFFWASWAGPAQMEKQTLEKIAPDYASKVSMWILDIDTSPITPPKYGVNGVPTMLIFKKGMVTSRQVGLLNETQIRQWLDANTP